MSKSLTLGSFFDGIGGWLLAAKHAGVNPVWASEIDDFPATVSAHHFPQVTQLGDITKINVDELEPVDIICAGSPCQDLSVAGKREGLAGERSGLFRTAIDIVHRLRERTGKPRYFVWENVPGAFSSNKGLDFAAVLSEISQTEIPMPACGKWAESGVVEWDGGSLAWRVLDAQYWGVPQRRKRIFLVADFAGHSAGEILFEREGLHGNFAESEREREETATDVGTSIDSTSGTLTPWDAQSKRIMPIDGKAPTLQARAEHGGEPGNIFDTRQIDTASGFKYRQGAKAGGIGWQNGKAPTQELSQNCAVYDMTHADEVMRPVKGNKSNCLNSRMGTGGNQVPVIAYCVGNGQADQTRISDKVGALNCMHDQQAVVVNKTIRRLTPTECERLQGLPDGYTDIEFNGKPAPDSRRYKALGNGMAQPCADFVIRRIAEVVSNEA